MKKRNYLVKLNAIIKIEKICKVLNLLLNKLFLINLK